jgi:hypothetical protein
MDGAACIINICWHFCADTCISAALVERCAEHYMYIVQNAFISTLTQFSPEVYLPANKPPFLKVM